MAKPKDAAAEPTKAEGSVKVTKANTTRADKKKKHVEARDDKSRVKFESTLTRLEAVAYFEAIVSGLRKGALKFKQGEDAISLSPAEHVDVEVKAQRKRGKENVSFEIAWHTADDGDLTISSN